MNYEKIYYQLVEKAKSRGLDKSSVGYYTEIHHIIPRCMGGGDEPSNLVMFKAREHFLAHMLLWKAYPEEVSLMRAAHMMSSRWVNETVGGSGAGVNSKVYSKLREEYAEAVREQVSGEGNPFYGKTHSAETVEKMKSSKQKYYHRQRLINWRKDNDKYMSRFRFSIGEIAPFEVNDKCRIKPLHGKYDLDLWMNAEAIKDYWQRAGKPDVKFLSNQIFEVSGIRFPYHKMRALVKLFIEGWEPSTDPSFVLTALNTSTADFNDRVGEFREVTTSTVEEIRDIFFNNWLESRESHRAIISEHIQTNGYEKHKNNSKAKMSLVDVTEACILWNTGLVEQKRIANLYGVARNTISNAAEADGRWLTARRSAEDLLSSHYKDLPVRRGTA